MARVNHRILSAGHRRGGGELLRTTYGDAMLHEDVGIHDGDELVEEVRLGVKQLRRQLLHHGLQLLGCGGRHSVPRLRFTPGNKSLCLKTKQNKWVLFEKHEARSTR